MPTEWELAIKLHQTIHQWNMLISKEKSLAGKADNKMFADEPGGPLVFPGISAQPAMPGLPLSMDAFWIAWDTSRCACDDSIRWNAFSDLVRDTLATSSSTTHAPDALHDTQTCATSDSWNVSGVPPPPLRTPSMNLWPSMPQAL